MLSNFESDNLWSPEDEINAQNARNEKLNFEYNYMGDFDLDDDRSWDDFNEGDE